MTLVFWFVFKHILNIHTKNYSAYLLAAILPYSFMQQAILDSCSSIVSSHNIIKKVYFPREIMPLATILANFVHFILALCVFVVFLVVIFIANPGDFALRPSILLLPVLMAISLALTMGIGLFVSALNVFYEDVKYIAQITLFLLFYLCPVLYFSEHVRYSAMFGGSELFYKIYHLNPFAMLVTAYRKALLPPIDISRDGQTFAALPLDFALLGVAAVVSLMTVVLGYLTFNKLKHRFVERK